MHSFSEKSPQWQLVENEGLRGLKKVLSRHFSVRDVDTYTSLTGQPLSRCVEDTQDVQQLHGGTRPPAIYWKRDGRRSYSRLFSKAVRDQLELECGLQHPAGWDLSLEDMAIWATRRDPEMKEDKTDRL